MLPSQFAIPAPGVPPPDSAIRIPHSVIACPSSHDFCFPLSVFQLWLLLTHRRTGYRRTGFLTSHFRSLASVVRPLSSGLLSLLFLLLTALTLPAAESPATIPAELDNSISAVEARIAAARKARSATNTTPATAPAPADLDNSVSAIEARIAATRKARAATNGTPAASPVPAHAAAPAAVPALPMAATAPPASSTASTTNPASTTSTNSGALDDTYRLAIGDRLSFRIVEDEEDARQLVVTDSGEVELPYGMGRFSALRRTCQELAAALKTELEKTYYYQATIILAVDAKTRTSTGRVYLTGAVKVGVVEMLSDETLTLSKAILRSGGLTDFADKKNVKVTRKGAPGGAGDKIFTVNVVEILEKGKTDTDLKLEPDDLIFVPERSIRF